MVMVMRARPRGTQSQGKLGGLAGGEASGKLTRKAVAKGRAGRINRRPGKRAPTVAEGDDAGLGEDWRGGRGKWEAVLIVEAPQAARSSSGAERLRSERGQSARTIRCERAEIRCVERQDGGDESGCGRRSRGL